MDDFIRRQNVLDKLFPVDPENDGSDGCTVILQNLTFTSAEIEGLIDQIPSADVAPVVHAKWLDEDFPEEMATVHGFAICSACGELSHKAEHGYNILSEYCPHCGAKMDLEEHHESNYL